jgi:hypothetical protein
MAEAGQQQQPAGDGTNGASTVAAASQPIAADSQQQAQDGRKSKQPIKYVPPKPASGNPNFGPRKAWPGGSITVKHPKNPLPPGVHRWKGGGSQAQAPSQASHRGPQAYTSQRFGSGAPPRSSRLRTAGGGHGGGIDMHSAVALQLQSAPGGRGGAPPRSGPGAGAGSLNGRSGQNGHYGGSSEAPEPGEVPAGPRRHALERIVGGHAAAGGRASAPARGSGLAQLYKQQGGGSLLEAMAQRRNSGGSPARGSPSSGGGGGGGGNPVFRRPSGGSPAFKEGFSIANKLLAALEQNAVQLAASHAAVIAAHLAGEEGNSLRLGFKSRIRSQQQEFADDEAYVAELNEYLAAASGRASGNGNAEVSPATATRGSFSFDVDSAAFGSSLSVGRPDDAWAASDSRRGVGVLRHGSRRVEVVGGNGGDRQVSPGGDIGGGGGGVNGSMGASSFKGFKRKAPWQPSSAAAPSRKVVAVGGGGGGFGSGGSGGFNSKYSKPAAAKAQPHTFKKQPAAAAQQAPASVEQKLGMSLDAIAGKPGSSKPVQQSAVRAAAGGGGGGGAAAASAAAAAAGGAAADGGSRKHKPIAWGA